MIYCLYNYIAFGLLTQVDNIFAMSLKDFPLKSALKNPPIKEKGGLDGVRWTFSMNLGKWFYKAEKFFYISYYYYFMPFTVIFITAFFGTEPKWF